MLGKCKERCLFAWLEVNKADGSYCRVESVPKERVKMFRERALNQKGGKVLEFLLIGNAIKLLPSCLGHLI